MAKFTIPAIKGYVRGEFGKTIRLTLKDFDGVAQDVSSYDGTKTAVARHDDTGDEVSASVSFTNSGSDGKVEWTFADGDIDKAGLWEVQIIMEDSGQNKKGITLPSPMDVADLLEN